MALAPAGRGAPHFGEVQRLCPESVGILNRNDVRTEVDDRNEKIGRKIRDNELKRIPYLLIVGEKEEAEGLVSVRAQGEGRQGPDDDGSVPAT